MTELTANIRPGHEVDPQTLYPFLVKNLPDLQGAASAADLRLTKFAGGYSNLTYRLELGNYDMVLRRPPFGANIKSGHDMEREYRILSGLKPLYAAVPRPILYSDDLTVMAAPFYLMERANGVIFYENPPAGLDTSPAVMERISTSLIDNLVTIHSLDYASSPELSSLARSGGNYVERQIKGWLDRYSRARTDDLPTLERTGSWLLENMPADAATCLIHNDYKYDNVMLDPQDLTRVVAVLDWEMATIGDPLMDLGTTLGYWIEPNDPEYLLKVRTRASVWPGNLDRTAVVQYYALKSGREISDPVFYFAYGMFKIAVIIQQIYARYKQGYSADERFSQLGFAVKALGDTAALAIEKKRIDHLG